MKIEIELTELDKKAMFFHQGGFTLSDGEKEIIVFDTVTPGGMPVFDIREGKNKGRRFTIKKEELQRICEMLYDLEDK